VVIDAGADSYRRGADLRRGASSFGCSRGGVAGDYHRCLHYAKIDGGDAGGKKGGGMRAEGGSGICRWKRCEELFYGRTVRVRPAAMSSLPRSMEARNSGITDC